MTQATDLLEDLREARQWLEDQIDGSTEERGRDARITCHIEAVSRAIYVIVALRNKEPKK